MQTMLIVLLVLLLTIGARIVFTPDRSGAGPLAERESGGAASGGREFLFLFVLLIILVASSMKA